MTSLHFPFVRFVRFANGLFVLIFFIIACAHSGESERTATVAIVFPDSTQTRQWTGHQLAIAYCQACHAFPEPSLLDKRTWEKRVLPNMGLRMGINPSGENPYVGMTADEIHRVVAAGTFATQPVIPLASWRKIVAYYAAEAPESLAVVNPVVAPTLPLFSVRTPPIPSGKFPLTTLVHYDSLHTRTYVGDRLGWLRTLDAQFRIVDSLQLPSPPSGMGVSANGTGYALTMGVMDPSDRREGELLNVRSSSDSLTQILTQLPRPVHVALADLNGDEREDVILSGFGNHTGYLAWYESTGDNQFQEHRLKNVPGTRKTIVRDFNGDRRPDIMALLAQGDERITLFYNRGDGTFREENVLRFPPVYGSSYFEIADFNGDDTPDILYTNGDNADYSTILKPYHGVRIFLNNGKNQFCQQYFFPMYGASQARARDFDQDGDVDIAAISFFPDFARTPYAGFVYLENTGNATFSARTFPEAASGRWLTMDVGDVDRDGDEDILLGSFIGGPLSIPEQFTERWRTFSPPMLVLRNQTVF